MRCSMLLLLYMFGCFGSRDSIVPSYRGGAGAASHKAGPRKLALLIGIGHYYQLAAGHGQRPWPILHVKEEMEEYRQVLIRDYGFGAHDVHILLEEQATAANIRAAVKQHLLDQAGPGDIVLFHYSGHGQQIPDQEDPVHRDEPDGLDESLVPYDALNQSVAEGVAKNIRDDEVDEWLETLAGRMSESGKLSGHVTVTLDTCFSGAATRGLFTARGRPWDVNTDGPLPLLQQSLSNEGPVRLLGTRRVSRPNVVVMAASRSDQSAWEKDGRGVFTRHWVRLLAGVRSASLPTYAAAIDKLAIDIAAEGLDQTPQVEGAAEHVLFSGHALPLARPREGVRVLRDAQEQWWLQAGEIHGVTPGSRYRLYKPGSAELNEAASLAETVAIYVTPFRARLKPLLGSSLQGSGALAVETSHSYSMAPLLTVLTGFESVPALHDLISALDIVQIVQGTSQQASTGIGQDPDLEIRYIESTKTADIRRPADRVTVKSLPLSTQDAVQFESWLRMEWRRRQLIRMRHENDATRVDLELLPVEAEMDQARNIRGQPRLLNTPQPAAHLRLPRNGFFALRLLNRSSRALYVAVLALSPDGDIELLFPRTDGGMNRIPPGGSLVPPLQTHVTQLVGQPGDRVVFKVIATDVYVDLTGASTRGALIQSRSPSPVTPVPHTYRPLQWLLAGIAAGTRGAGTSLQAAEWGTSEASLTVAPR